MCAAIGTISVNANILAKLPGVVAAASLALTPVMAQAQSGAEGGNALNLPQQMTMLTNADPNVRRATAVVNGDVITGTDLDHRVALVLDANQAQISAEEMQRVRAQVLRNLIDETLQIQAATAEEITVDKAEINQTYARVSAQNNRSVQDMDKYLISIGSSPVSLKRQIEGEMAWQRLLGRKVSFFVNVSSEEVAEMKERLEAAKGSDEYRLGEIYLSATPASKTAVEANARKIVEQLRQGGSFAAYARQFSEASTAAVGGDLGWIRLPQLKNGTLENVVRDMQPGQLIGPIEIPGGYWIGLLIEKRQVLMADPRDATLSLKQIQMTFEPGATEAQNKARLETFAAGLEQMRGCGSADDVANALGATVVSNQIRAGALPEQLQQIVLSLSVGQMTPLFGSAEEGVRTLMLCGRDDPEVTGGPSLEDLRNRLEDERIGRAAQRYLRDLRNDAYIEYN